MNKNDPPQRSDPVGDRYYASVSKVDAASDALFYVGAALSLVVLFVPKAEHPAWHHFLMTLFVMVVIGLFVLGLALRLYLSPRAEDKRRLDFFSSALGIALTHQTSVQYYNNAETKPFRRLAAQVLENTHFTKSIALTMARTERAKVAIYALVWLACVLSPKADVEVIVAVSQAIFSEQIISRYLRLEWLRASCERIYDDVHQSFAAQAGEEPFRALALSHLVSYEAAKAIAAVPLSSRIFARENPRLSSEWDQIKKSLGLETGGAT